MDSIKRTARFAGFLYLLLVVIAPIGLMYVPGKLIVRGDAAATANRILASPSILRMGIVSSLFAAVLSIFLVLVLHRLLKAVDRQQAALMVILTLVQVPIAFVNEISQITALELVRGADFLSVFTKPQRDALAMLFLRLHGHGIIASEIFWGLWLLPFGLLVFRSGFLPRILGLWLIVNGVAYVIVSLTGLLLPQYYEMVFRIAFPILCGEMAIMLWLLIVGARPRPAASSGAAVV